VGGYARAVAAIDVHAFIAELEEWTRARDVVKQTYRYGPGPEHEGDLLLPAGDRPHRVAVLLHGGFWRAPFKRSIMDALAIDLARRGWATWNVEYRRGGSGGGASETTDDVRAAIGALERLGQPLQTSRLLVIGHSAGGQLALCAASIPAVASVVSLAGVCDLVAAAKDGIGDNAVIEFIGASPAQRPDAYAVADPMQQLPTGTEVLLAHGDADDRVPVALSRGYAVAARTAGDNCDLLELPGVDHFAVIDPRSDAWSEIARRLPNPA
jgi:acetyl esterase/lipase